MSSDQPANPNMAPPQQPTTLSPVTPNLATPPPIAPIPQPTVVASSSGGNNIMRIVIIIIGIVVLLAMAGAIYYFLNKQAEPEPTTPTAKTQPTPAPSVDPLVDELNKVDPGDIDADFKDVDRNLNTL